MTTPPPPAPQPPFAPMPVASTAVPAPPTTTAPVYEVEPVEYAPVNLFQRAQDDSHLKVLMICQYVYAGVVGLFSLFPVIHVAMGVAMINGAFNGGPNPPPPEVGWLFVGIGGGLILFGELLAALNLFAAYGMSRRRRRVLSLVVAGVNCLWIPFGTILGVFTFIVLLRDGVRQQYDEAAAARRATGRA